MKYLLPLLACVVLISCKGNMKKEKTDLERLHYNGKVKMVTYKIYRAIDDSGKAKKGMIASKVVTMCNRNGYFVEQDNYKAGEQLNYRIIRRYDTTNNDLNEEDRMETVMVYLSQGNQKGDSVKLDKDIYTYKKDANGNNIEVKVSRNNKPAYKDVNTFDQKGNITYTEEYAPWDTLYKKEFFKYDEKGNMIEKMETGIDTANHIKYSYKYDDKGNVIECLSVEGKTGRSSKDIMKYDDKGNIIEDINTDNTGYVIWSWRYEFTDFDKNGNWTKEVSYSDKKPSAITERTIEYY